MIKRCKKCNCNNHYPLSKGFALDKENAVLFCKSCNTSKADKLPEEFYSSSELTQLEWILATA